MATGAEQTGPGIAEEGHATPHRKVSALDLKRLDSWCEKGILGLVLVILVYGPVGFGAVRHQEFLVLQGLTIGVLGLWTVRWWIRPGHRFLFAPICVPVLLFVLYAVLRYHQAPIELEARQELVRILVYSVLFLAVLDNLHHQDAVQLISFTLIALGMVLALYAAYQFLSDSKWVLHTRQWDQYSGRASGTYICPNHLSGFLEMILPIALGYVLLGRLKATPKVFLGYAALAMGAGIAFTVSRGGWLTTVLVVSIFFGLLIRRPGLRLPAALFFTVLVLGGGIYLVKSERFWERVEMAFPGEEGQETLHDFRLRVWPATVDIWQAAPWLGVGPAHFDWYFRQHRPPDVQLQPVRAHNDVLNTLADWGLAGMGIVLAAWGALGWQVWRSRKFLQRNNELGSKPSNRYAFVFGASLGLLAMLIHSFIDFNMHIPANAITLVVLMALVTSHLRYATERFWVRPGWIGKSLATILCLAAALYLSSQLSIRAQETYWLRKAEVAQAASDWNVQLQHLLKAHEVEPRNAESLYKIGEIYRSYGWYGQPGFADYLRSSLPWFELAMKENPLDPFPHLRYGMALDRLKRISEAEPHFEEALRLDPNNYYVVTLRGWHEMQKGNYQEAKEWFEKSYQLKYANELAQTYLRIAERQLNQPEWPAPVN